MEYYDESGNHITDPDLSKGTVTYQDKVRGTHKQLLPGTEQMGIDGKGLYQEITDHETVRQALRSIKENERRIVLERIIEEKSFGQLSDELGMSYKTVASLYYRAIKKLRRFMEEGESK